MILKKITTGFVIQEFDTDKGTCVSQSFVAGDSEYETQDGEPINVSDFEEKVSQTYFPFNMVQP